MKGFRLGEWMVRPSIGRLSGPAGEVRLEPRAMEVLVYLAEHFDQMVSRRQIIDAVWRQEFVSDATLSGNIAKIRKALGDNARSPRFVETLSKRGYRLLVRPVRVLDIVPSPGDTFLIGDWLVEPDRNRMISGHAMIQFKPCTMDVLQRLAERAGEPVAKQELAGLIGTATPSSDQAVTRSIEELQNALNGGPNPVSIEVEPNGEYRLVAAVASTEPSATVTRFPAIRADPEAPVFVGRGAEMGRLQGLFQNSLGGNGRIAFVTGEAGTGKTALVQEFVRRAGTGQQDLVVAAGVCSAQTGIGDAFAPWRQILAQLTGDVESGVTSGSMLAGFGQRLWRTAPTTTEAVIESGRDLVGTLIPGPALLARVRAAASAEADWLPVLRELVSTKSSLPPDATLQQAGVFMQVCRVLGAVARRRPLLIVLEDLHWADSGSIALLFHLGRELNAHRILVLGSYRPTDVALGRGGKRHPLEGIVAELKGRQAELILELDQAGNRGFVDALVDSEPNRLGNRFRATLYRQTAGHALFTVEVLRTMKHRRMLVQDPENLWLEGEDLDWDQLPERVDGVVAARIQRLPGELRDLLTVAAVEGEEFTGEVVARILGIDPKQVNHTLSRELEGRHRLVRAVGIRTLPDRRLAMFGFSHILFRRHLYNGLNEVDRVQLHHDVARVLEEFFAHDTEEIAVRLAHHFEEAGVTERALHYLHQSGICATRMTANREAIDHLTKAFQLLETLPESRERDRTELTLQFALQGPWSGLQGWAGPEVSRAVERAHVLADRVGDETQRAWVLYLTGSLYTSNGRVPEIAEVADRLRKLAHSMGDEAFGLMADALTSYWATYTGRSSAGLDGWKSVIERYDPKRHRWIAHAGGGDPAVLGHAHIALLLARMGFLDQCLEWVERGMELAETVGHHNSTCHLMAVGFGCHAYRYEFDRAAALVKRTLELASDHGFEHWIVACRAWRGLLRLVQGDFDGGIALISESLDRLRALGFEGITIDLLCGLSLGYLANGQPHQAMALLDEALEAVNRQRPHVLEPEVHRHCGDVLYATGAVADAEAAYRKAVRLSQSQTASLFELFAASRLARLQHAQGRIDEARDVLAPVVCRFTEGLDTPPLIEARALLDELGDQNE